MTGTSIYFLIGAAAYSITTAIAFIPYIRDSKWFIPVGLCLAMVTNFLWLTLAKEINEPGKILLYGFWWDVMKAIIFVVLPVFAFSAKLSSYAMLGLLLMSIGFLLTRA